MKTFKHEFNEFKQMVDNWGEYWGAIAKAETEHFEDITYWEIHLKGSFTLTMINDLQEEINDLFKGEFPLNFIHLPEYTEIFIIR